MSDLLEKSTTDQETITIDTNNGDHDRFRHYFTKKAIEDNTFNGTPMTAVCGKVVYQQVDPKGKPICQECIDKMDARFGPEEPNS